MALALMSWHRHLNRKADRGEIQLEMEDASPHPTLEMNMKLTYHRKGVSLISDILFEKPSFSIK
jgi:hypothetical protein